MAISRTTHEECVDIKHLVTSKPPQGSTKATPEPPAAAYSAGKNCLSFANQLLKRRRRGWNPCNLAGPSAVHILDPGASGRFAAWRRDRGCARPGNRVGEGIKRLQRSLQQACNLPATCLQPLGHSSVTPVLPQRYSSVGLALQRLNFINSLASLAGARRHRSL